MKSGKLQEAEKKMMQRSTSLRKKLYKDQYDFNKNVFEHLNRALRLVFEDSECGDLIGEGMNLLKNRNKQLKIADRFGWEQPKRISVTLSLTTPVTRNA